MLTERQNTLLLANHTKVLLSPRVGTLKLVSLSPRIKTLKLVSRVGELGFSMIEWDSERKEKKKKRKKEED
jgi:hypothetical protein